MAEEGIDLSGTGSTGAERTFRSRSERRHAERVTLRGRLAEARAKRSAARAERRTAAKNERRELARQEATSRAEAPAREQVSRRRRIASVSVVAFAFALLGTFALPAYAFNPNSSGTSAAIETADDDSLTSRAQAQSVAVASNAAIESASRDGVEVATRAEALNAQIAARGWAGPSIRDLLSNPPNPSFSLAGIFEEALKYQGVPYVYGGATPAGFDCSGFTMYVYATFGVSLPHGATSQLNMGTPIAEADAQPGDLVWMPGHVGIWAGPGMMIDGTDYGDVVRLRPIYTSNYVVFRIGI